MVKRKPKKTKGPTAPTSDKKPTELQWNQTCYVPRRNTKIVFYWLGSRFTGTFIKSVAPWGGTWDVRMRYFSVFESDQLIRTRQIEGWAYADGSKPDPSSLYA